MHMIMVTALSMRMDTGQHTCKWKALTTATMFHYHADTIHVHKRIWRSLLSTFKVVSSIIQLFFS